MKVSETLRGVKDLLIIVLLFLAGLFLFQKCKTQSEYEDFALAAEERFTQNNATLLDARESIYQGQVAVVEANKKIQSLLDTIKHLKEPRVITVVEIETKIDTVFVPWLDEEVEEMRRNLMLRAESPPQNVIEVPKKFLKIDQWYTIGGTVKQDGIYFDNLTYRNDFYIATGKQDHGSFIKNIFKRNETIITLKDNNPYSATKTLSQTIINNRERKWHIGPQAGFVLSNQKFIPSVGLGITYSIISF